jgi:hypothetical protein
MRLSTWAKRAGIGLVALFATIQLVPYGRDHVNAPVVAEPSWDSPRTRELAKRACFDCHSNEVRWPWYSYVAPISWIVQRDVEDGRAELNFSEWHRPQREARDAAEVVADGEMPLRSYLWTHSGARLDERERAELVSGLEASVGGDERGRDRERDPARE